jgi:micrococcal nuclease
LEKFLLITGLTTLGKFSGENLHEKGDRRMRSLTQCFPSHICDVKADFPFDIKAFSLCIVVGILISNGLRAQQDFTGKVTTVIDGNTVEVSSQANETHKILLVGIDSPELDQEYGDQAKKFLEKLILNKNVVVQFKGKDRFGNRLAVIMINGKNDPRVELLREGLAWTAEKNPPEDLEPYKTWAQRKGRGLWKQENPVPPWTYRRNQTMLKPKSS